MALEMEGGGKPAATPVRSTGVAAAADRLSFLRLLAFATPCLPLAAMMMPVTAYLPNYYATDLGVRPAELAWAFAAVRFFDLWFDPALGFAVDKTNTRFGRFRPWFVAGAPIAMLAVFMLFLPQSGIGGTFILTWLIIGFVGQSMASLGHTAWAASLTPGYDERSRVYSFWQAMTVVGMISILLIPPLTTKVFGMDHSFGVHAMGVFVILSMPVTLLLALWATGEQPVKPHHESPRLSQVLKLMIRPNVLRVLGSDICWGTGLSLAGTLLFFYFDSVRGVDRATAGLMLIAYFTGALIGAPIWSRVSKKLGKHKALMLGGLGWAIMQLSILVSPNSVLLGFLTMLIAGIPFAAGAILLKSMMADVADEERLISGVDRTGLLFSLLTGSVKIGSMLAVGGSLYALDIVGFDAKAGGANSEAALTTLSMMFCLGPAALALTAAALISGYRLDQAAHDEVRARLLERDLGHEQPPLVG